jgi:hypothetical protein
MHTGLVRTGPQCTGGADGTRFFQANFTQANDAGALYQERSRPGIAGHTHPAGPTPYRMREGSHVDPDGNLIRFGSPQQD